MGEWEAGTLVTNCCNIVLLAAVAASCSFFSPSPRTEFLQMTLMLSELCLFASTAMAHGPTTPVELLKSLLLTFITNLTDKVLLGI